MGGRSNKADTNTTTNYEDRQFANQDGLVATEGARLTQANTTYTTVNTLDAGAIKAASELVGQTIAANATGQQAAYKLAENVSGGNAAMMGKFARDAGELSYYTTEKTVGENSKIAGTAIDATGKTALEAMQALNAAAQASVAAQAAAGREALASNSAALRDAFGYSTGVNTNLAKTYDSALGMVESLSSKVVNAIADAGKKGQDTSALAIGKVESAWASAKQAEKDLAGGDYRMLMMIGAAIIGVVAVLGMGKK